MLHTDVPVLMHVVTRKGAGYAPAVQNPEKFHGIAPFEIATGDVKKKPSAAPSYTSVFGKALAAEARRDDRIVAITAAMKGGTGLDAFAEEFPERFVDAGIAEEHAVGLASGLATGGMKPVVALYSTFLQRAIDQVIINNALPNLDVVFAIDRAGIVGEDGPTHHGMFDLAYMRMIPHMRVLAPSDEAELVHALHTALELGGPFAIRYPRGAAEGVALPDEPHVLEEGRARVIREGDDVAILAFGRMVSRAKEAAALLGRYLDYRYTALPAGCGTGSPDPYNIAEWAQNGVSKCWMYGVIDMSDESNVSYPDGTTSSALDFRPNDLVAGSEAAQWIANANALDMSAVAAPEKPGFADALIRAVDAEGNWSLSPYSIRMCLAMLANGTKGETQRELLDALQIEDLEAFNQTVKEQLATYDGYARIMSLETANSLWIIKAV